MRPAGTVYHAFAAYPHSTLHRLVLSIYWVRAVRGPIRETRRGCGVMEARAGRSSTVAVAFLLMSATCASVQAQDDPPIQQQALSTIPDTVPPAVSGPETVFAPQIQPSLHVMRAVGAIELDGELDDPGWRGAARADGFSMNFPEEMGRPDVESEVLVTYDEDNLYLAFIAHDDPSGIRASLRDRDEMWQDDYFGILLDTYGDASWAVYLFANPYGVQGDTRFAVTSGEDSSFDLLCRSGGPPSGARARAVAGSNIPGPQSAVTTRASCASTGPSPGSAGCSRAARWNCSRRSRLPSLRRYQTRTILSAV